MALNLHVGFAGGILLAMLGSGGVSPKETCCTCMRRDSGFSDKLYDSKVSILTDSRRTIDLNLDTRVV